MRKYRRMALRPAPSAVRTATSVWRPWAPHQEQVGHVGARDEQDDGHRAQQHPDHGGRVSDHLFVQGANDGREPGFLEQRRAQGPAEVRGQAGEEARQVGVGLGQGHTGQHAGQHLVRDVAVVGLRLGRSGPASGA